MMGPMAKVRSSQKLRVMFYSKVAKATHFQPITTPKMEHLQEEDGGMLEPFVDQQMVQCCPLDPNRIRYTNWHSVEELRRIDIHLMEADDCSTVHPTLRDLVLTEHYEGATPLIQAVREGSLEAVQHIVEQWGADVHQVGTYYRVGQKIQGVTPLFVAAARGYADIVRYLVNQGADVNVRTLAIAGNENPGRTPLNAAVQYLVGSCTAQRCSQQSNIIRFFVEECGADPSPLSDNGTPIWVLSYYDVDAVCLLIELGMDLFQRSPSMERTCVHYWAGRTRDARSLEVIQRLLERGAELKPLDRHRLTPLMVAAIGNEGVPNVPVLEFFLGMDSFSREEKVDALEMAGSSLLGYKDDPTSVDKGFHYWTLAMQLRLDQQPTLLKCPSLQLQSESNGFRAGEFTTMDQLEELKQSPPSLRKVQAVLVRQRIFSGISPSAYMRYHWLLVKNLIRRFTTHGEYTRVLDMNLNALEAARRFGPQEECTWVMVVTATQNLLNTFKGLQRQGNDALLDPQILLTTIQLILDTERHHLLSFSPAGIRLTDGRQVQHLETISQFVSLLASMSNLPYELMRCLYQLVQRDGRDANGRNLLLIACEKGENATLVPTVRLLLHVGADPNAVDWASNSPLHIVAMRPMEPVDSATGQLLVEAGTHLDRVNIEGHTASEVYLRRRWTVVTPTWSQRVPALACVSARSIRQNYTPYDRTQIPACLFSFIRMH